MQSGPGQPARSDNHTVIEIHRALLGDIAPDMVGRYRGEQVWIGGELPQVAAFVPPHHDRVGAAMDDLISFAHRTDMPLLVQAAIAHAQFETIHPFPDGNGRTGRALVQAMLRNGGLLRHMTVPVSSGLLTNIDRYFDALEAYRAGDPNPIVQAFSAATFAGLQNARHLASHVTSLQAEWAERMAGLRSDAAARRLVTLSIEHPAINSRLAVERLGASLPTVINGLQQLVDRGILTPANSKRRNRIWVNGGVIDALDAFALRSGRRVSPTL